MERRELIKRFANMLGMRWYHLALPAGLSLLISLTDAAGLGLLVPLAQGVAVGDFAVVTGQPVIDNVLVSIVQSITGPDAHIASTFFVLAGIILSLNTLSLVLLYLNTVFGRYLQGLYKMRLHTAIYRRYFEFGKLYFDRVSQGHSKKLLDYTARVTELVRILQDSLTNAARLVAYVAIMAWLSWQLLVFVVIVFPFVYVVSRTIMRRVHTWWDESKQVSLELGRESFNIFSAMPLVWSYGQEVAAQKKYASMNEELRRIELRANAFGDLTSIVPRIFALLVLGGIVAFIALVLRSDSPRDITTYVVFLYVTAQTLPLFKVFTQAWASLSEMTPPVREIMRLFNDKQKHRVPSGDIAFAGLQKSIEFRDLSFQYDDRPLLRQVSLTIRRGDFVALVGPSGSGKSTLLSLLMRFYDCPPNTIFVDDRDIRTLQTASLRKHMAYVDQEAVLIHDTLRSNIAYGYPQATEAEVRAVLQAAHLSDLVDRLPEGLETLVGDRGVQLSGGERQRVALARALLKGSEIVLLDEATSALDSSMERRVQMAMEEALADKTSIVVAHRLSTVQRADVIVYMDEGVVKEVGVFDELIRAKGAFYRQWQMVQS